jgi:hypothetical protein
MFTAMRIALSQQRAFAHCRCYAGWGQPHPAIGATYLTRCGVITLP